MQHCAALTDLSPYGRIQTVGSMLNLMAINPNSHMPSYMHSTLQLLRSMGESFNYDLFRLELDDRSLNFSAEQKAMLKLRMDLLESFLYEKSTTKTAHSFNPAVPRFAAGKLIIIDLTRVMSGLETIVQGG